MDTKRIARFYIATIIIAIGFIVLFPQGVVAESFNETFYFNGSGGLTESLTNAGGEGGPGWPNDGITGSLNKYIFINFNNVKIISYILLSNTWSSWISGNPVHSLGSSNTGINENLTSCSVRYAGSLYGDCIIGWKRTTDNNFNYYIRFTYVNTSLANSLSGKLQLDITYDQYVFSDILSSPVLEAGNRPAYNYVSWSTNTPYGHMGFGFGTGQVFYSFNAFDTVVASTPINNVLYINIYKHLYNTRINLTNVTGYSFFDQTSITNVNKTIDISKGLYLYLKDISSDGVVNRTIAIPVVAYVPPPSLPNLSGSWGSGTISFNRTTYNVLNLYNLSVNLQTANYNDYIYFVDTIDPFGNVFESGQLGTNLVYPTNITADLSFNYPGIWEVKLYACGYGICSVNRKDIANNYATVTGERGLFNQLYWGKKIYGNTEVANITYEINASNWNQWFTSYSVDILKDNIVIYSQDILPSQDFNSFGYILYPFSTSSLQGKYIARLNKYYLFSTETLLESTTTMKTGATASGFSLSVTPSTNCYYNINYVVYTPDLSGVHLSFNQNEIEFKNLTISSSTQSGAIYSNKTGIITVNLLNETGIKQTVSVQLFKCVVNGTIPTPTPTPGSGQPGGSVSTSSIILLLQTNIFWALLITVGMMLGIGSMCSKNDISAIMPMSIAGFLGLAVFSFIGWMPLWIPLSIVFIAIVSFAWSQASKGNTGGGN